jgi:DUF4097 and DUF4098 domain-containing protein YvlB
MTTRSMLSIVPAGVIVPLVLAAGAAAQSAEPRVRDVVREVAERGAVRAYQGRNNGPEQTERISRKVKIAKDGRLSVDNISGDIVVNGGGSGDEISIEAVKKTRGDRRQLSQLDVDIEERGGRVDIRTIPSGRNSRAWVDYTITVPASVGVEARSISGDVRVTNVQGVVRGETVSGDIVMSGTPNVENAKSVSGDVSLAGVSTNGDLTAASGSGNLTARGLKVRGLELSSISGDMTLTDVICDRLGAKSVSGTVDFGGRIIKNGRYEFTSHSGDLRLRLQNPGGFELNANSFSGTVRSDISLVIHSDGDRRAGRARGRGRDDQENHSMQATYGDGSALLLLRTFSGDIVLTEQ